MTVQRRVILQAVLARSDHPTADQILDDVQDRLTGVSRTTVYRVLDTLVSLGVIDRPSHTGAVMRYDPNTHRHHHLACIHCDRVVDVDDAGTALDTISLPGRASAGFEITDYSINYRGICPTCRKKRRRPTRGGSKFRSRPSAKAGTR